MRKIGFLLPPPGISGGLNVLFHHARALAEQGDSVFMITRDPVKRGSISWHPIVERFGARNPAWVCYGDLGSFTLDIAIATWWRTYFDLWRIQSSDYAYFVQSIESRFYLDDETLTKAVVDASYDLEVGFITEAKWIRDYLSERYGFEAELVPNGIDKAVFRPGGQPVSNRIPGTMRVLVEGPLDSPFKNVCATISACRRSAADEVWLLTSSRVEKVPGVDRVFSCVPNETTAEIYRACDVLVKLSYVEGMFGPPLEMFHCGGTCVVYAVTGHDEYVRHGYNGLVAPIGDEAAVCRYLNDLKAYPALLAKLKANALGTAAEWGDWRASSQLFFQALDRVREKNRVTRAELERHSRNALTLLAAAHEARMLRHRLAKARHHAQSLEARLQATYNSTSWKVTAPLRILGAALRSGSR